MALKKLSPISKKSVTPKAKKPKGETQQQPNNPLHGIKLADLLKDLIDAYGWEKMAERTHIKCFENNPTYKSSLRFLRTTPWAREKVERMYLKLLRSKEK